MHSSLRVCLAPGGLGALLIVLGLGWGPEAKAVHEPAGVVPVDPFRGDLLHVGEGLQRAGAEW